MYCNNIWIHLHFTDNDQSVLPDNLMQVRLPIVTRTQCRQAYGAVSIDDKKVCTGDRIQGGIDTCSVSIFRFSLAFLSK